MNTVKNYNYCKSNMELLDLRFVVILLMVLIQSLIFVRTDKITRNYQIVKTTKGFIRGVQEVTLFENKRYYSFKGIPYAKPPLDELRFRPPLRPTAWKGVLNTLEYGSECIQIPLGFKFDPSTPHIIGDEDCLYLNVFTPNVNENLPVIFWIHGGGFDEGTGNFYGPDFIINENIILVTINYRLGPFGFLSLGTRRYSGNMGLKDQLLALKWVNENIENFGGDKKRITISGQSAGAASCHFLTVSKASEYLFQQTTMMSGSILNIWFPNERKNNVAAMYDLAQRTDPSVRTMKDLEDFLQNVNATYLIDKTAFDLISLVGQAGRIMPVLEFSPVVETPYDDNYFLIETGEELIKNKVFHTAINTMFGFTNKEAFSFFGAQINNPTLLESFNENFEVQLPLNYVDEIKYKSMTYQHIAKQIHDSYFGSGVLVNNNTILEYTDLISDMWFRYPIILSAKIQASVSTGRTYLLEFSADTELNVFKALDNVTLPGAGHGDNLCYLFRCNVTNLYDNITSDSTTGKSIRTTTKLWANFIRNGDPTITNVIKPITKHKMNFFNITSNGVEIGVNPNAKSTKLWDEIYGKYYRSFLKTNILNG